MLLLTRKLSFGIPPKQANQQKHNKRDCINQRAAYRSRTFTAISPVRKRKQRPECSHRPMKCGAVLVVPDKPKCDQPGKHKERRKLLNQMYCKHISVSEAYNDVLNGLRQQTSM